MATTKFHTTDPVSYDEILALLRTCPSPCVSLFLPILHGERAIRQNCQVLEQLLHTAMNDLEARGIAAGAVAAWLKPVHRLLDDRSFWAQPGDGLAVFAAEGLCRMYRVRVLFEPQCMVDTVPYVYPLLPLLGNDGSFYLLTLGLTDVQLYKGTRDTLRPIRLHGIPESLEKVLATIEFEEPAGQGVQPGAMPHRPGARDGAIVKTETRRYFQLVEHAVSSVLRAEPAPLVLAGLSYLVPIYRYVNTYPQLIDGAVAYETGDLARDELHRRAWALAAPHFDRRRDDLEQYTQVRRRSPSQATTQLRAILVAAHRGQIDTLLVVPRQRRWGVFDSD
ncbi:MAG TPA: hypothetical protein VFT99_20135, partial [Roseiflexaceae bacterium]|nr:hypothetical protein [Roseiflexaceae bacterium]